MSFSNTDKNYFSKTNYHRDKVKIESLLTTPVLDDRWKATIQGGPKIGDRLCTQKCPSTGSVGSCDSHVSTKGYHTSCGPLCTDTDGTIYKRDYQYFKYHTCPIWHGCDADNNGGSCKAGTCRVRAYQRLYQVCGKFDGSYSCGVTYKNNVVGDCTRTDGHYKRGTDWNSIWTSVTSTGTQSLPDSSFTQPIESNTKAGHANCQYSFDMDALPTLKYSTIAPDRYNSCGTWLDTVLYGKGRAGKYSFPELPDPFKIWLKNSFIIWITCQYWYQGLYEGWSALDNWDFMSTGTESEYINRRDERCLQTMQSLYSTYYTPNTPSNPSTPSTPNTPNTFPKSLLDCLQQVLIVPIITTDGNDVYITFPLSYQYYNIYSSTQYESDAQRADYLSRLFSWILDDKNFSYEGKSSSKIPGLAVVNPDGVTINALNINLNNGEISKPEGVLYKEFMENLENKYTCDFIATYNVKCKITVWTPMLMLFVLTRIPTLTDAIIKKMTSDTFILTVNQFNNECNMISKNNKQKCHDYITTYCKKFSNATKLSPSLIGQYLFDGTIGGGSNACNCYNSLLQPSVIGYPGNPTAMCFDSNCNKNELQQLFDLSPSVCKTKCSEMSNWMFNSNPAVGKPVPQFFDSARYSDICGKEYTPLESRINIMFVVYLSITMTTIMVILYLFLLYFKVTNKKKYTILAVTGAVLLGITIFLPIDMKGTPNCEGTTFPQKSVCKSSITGISIPADFCGFMSACECQTDSDCGNNCKCYSQVCMSNSSNEGTTTLTNKLKIKYWQFKFSLILTILVMIIFFMMLLYKDIYVATFILCLGMTIIIFTSIPQFTTYTDARLSNLCIKEPPSEGERVSDARRTEIDESSREDNCSYSESYKDEENTCQ